MFQARGGTLADTGKAAAYRAFFGPSPELAVGDVGRLETSDLPGHADLAWASFPCQDLSLAGNGEGLKGERSGTFWSFWRLMRGLRAEGRARMGPERKGWRGR